MRFVVTVADAADLRSTDVLVDADPLTPVAELADALAGRVGGLRSPVFAAVDADAGGSNVVSIGSASSARGAPTATLGALDDTLYLGGRALDPQAPLRDSGVLDGSVLSLGSRAVGLAAEPAGMVELRVVAGPGAGTVHRLEVGDIVIGADRSCPVVLDDPATPPVAAVASVRRDGTVQVRAIEADTVLLDRAPLGDAAVDWPAGGELRIGAVLLEVHEPTWPDAALQPSVDGAWLDYNRPPRLLPPPRRTVFRLPKEPSRPTKAGLPLAAALAPAVLGVVMAVMFHQPSFLLLALMSPLMLFGQFVSSRHQGKKSYRQDMKDWRQTCAAIEADAADALVAERQARRAANPDPAALLMVAVGPRARLWERRRADPDHLSVRVGTVDLESEVVVEDPEQLEHRREVKRIAHDVPVALRLAEAGVLGVAGRGDLPRRVGAWLIGQLAVLQSPRDVSIYVLTDSSAETTWRWATWLPHLHPTLGQDSYALIGQDAETLGRRIAELSQLVAARQSAKADQTGSGRAAFADPDVVVLLDGARRLRSMPGVPTLLKDGPSVGVYCICLDADERQLPEECGAVVTEAASGLDVRQQRTADIHGVRADLVPAAWFQRVARAIAPVRDVSDSEDGGALPPSSRLLDVLGLEPPTEAEVVARWNRGGRSTEAVVGESIDGPFAIDLRRDGPHGLVAGTTGSGKSEFLQTLVASLAVANRPDAMTFVLVDYKGGAAFKDCVKLPHTVGMVTDLDTHLVERALTSLGAELTRREHILAAAGAKDLEDYVDYARRDAGLTPVPRLLIVIDEFASMARELPDFVTGLVNIAQRGRSLGIHLLLATQRPSGVVSPEIRANTNLRIALRVTDAGESTDVIDVPDAAQISKSTPGRAYVQLGHASLVPFQSGRVGGRRPGTAQPAESRPAPWLRALRWTDLGRPAPERPRSAAVEDAEITDLAVLVDAISQASAALRLPAQHSPWLPALPELLTVADLASPAFERADDPAPAPTAGGPTIPAVPFGLEDLPAAQQQRVARIDLATFGHLFVAGAPRSGRSQVLRTIAAMLAERTSTADVHLYGIDCGNGALLPLSRLPHCGAVVQRTQTERATRLINRLNAEVQRRQELLGAGGFADITEQRAGSPADERLPHLVVLLDRWEGFVPTLGEVDGGTLSDVLFMILREGVSVGVHVIVSGDRTLLSGRVSTLTDDKLVLRLTDRGDYSLAGLNARTLPEEIVQGRAFRADSGVETHIAVLGTDPSGPAQAQCIADIGAAAAARDADLPRGRRPFRIDVLPSRLSFAEAWGMRADDAVRPLWGLVGVGGDELLALGPDLAVNAPTFVVAGPPKSGRSTVLLSMTNSLLRGGAEVLVTAPLASPLRALEGRPGVRAVLTDDDLTPDELGEHLGGDGPVVLVMDDAEIHKDFMAGDYLRSFIRTAGTRTGLVIAGNAAEVCGGFMGWQIDMKKNRSGALLSPQDLTDGDIIGLRLPRSVVGGQVQPGRALVHLGDGELISVQVPLTTAAEVGTMRTRETGEVTADE